MLERVKALENPPKQIEPEPIEAPPTESELDALQKLAYLRRIALALERAFPEPPPPAEPSRPSDLSDLHTVTSEDADAKAREWEEFARRHGIAPHSDLFQELILRYEDEAARRGETAAINWDQVFTEARENLRIDKEDFGSEVEIQADFNFNGESAPASATPGRTKSNLPPARRSLSTKTTKNR